MDRGSAASTNPVEQEGDSDSGNPNDFMVQVNPSVRETAVSGKRSLEADVAATASVGVWPPVPRRQDIGCTTKGGLAHKIKACTARLHEDVIYCIIPNRIFFL